MKIRELMAKTVWTCRTHEPMSTVAGLMWEHDIGAVPVLGADGNLAGIVTDRDLCMAAYFTGQPLVNIPVEHAMSKSVFTVSPDQDVAAAEDIMRAKRIRRLPVLEGRKLVGMISLGDLARAAAQRRKEITTDEVDTTFAAILQPRLAAVA